MSDTEFDLPEKEIKERVKKPNQAKINLPEDHLEKLKKRKNENLVISFEFLVRKTELFSLGGAAPKDFVDLIDKLKMLTEINRDEFFGKERDKFNPDRCSFDDFDCEIPIMENETIRQYEFIKFRIRKRPRILSVIIGNVVYVVLIDFYHNLHLTDRYPNHETHDYFLTYEERLEEKIERLLKTIRAFEKQIEEKENELNEFLAGEKCEICGNDSIDYLEGYICKDCIERIE